ncbi:MAG: pyridoxal phosphate-dependent aminotransferase [Deltaproteobacteria bacterium]|nr:pyridoxal phosphate-dependent aminotransferase [Deltaproteobacteria bacterium]
MSTESLSSFRKVPRTGVIFVDTEARTRGYSRGHPDWANLGQGQPETGDLPGTSPRLDTIPLNLPDMEYASVEGLAELRDAVAQLYNTRYRRGMKSQYSAENVVIAGGGRTALTRALASVGAVNLGHFIPDYTAYEELLEVFGLFKPIPLQLDPGQQYDLELGWMERTIRGMGLGALLMSNPHNPTGKVIRGGQLHALAGLARKYDCALLMDEFYAHYVWDVPPGTTVSAAEWVEDVNRDPIVVLDGLTKNWRYPGLRLSWMLGPRAAVDAWGSAGSFIDGGAVRPVQRAAVKLLDPETVARDTLALQKHFSEKRTEMVSRLRGMGVRVPQPPQGTFYVWGSVEGLPDPLNDCFHFFRAALDRKVLCVPGVFFDVNPGKRRTAHHGLYSRHIRFSFGPPMDQVRLGLERLERMIGDAARAGA